MRDVKKEGYMRKKGARINAWVERYFALCGPTVSYYLKDTDLDPKGTFTLTSRCRVSEIRSDVYKKRKQFVFTITWPIDENSPENGQEEDVGRSESSPATPRTRGRPGTGIRRRGDKLGDEKLSATSPSAPSSSMSHAKIAAITVGGVALGAVTAGIGLLAGMVVVGIGAAAGSGAAAVSMIKSDAYSNLQLACSSYNETEEWVSALETQIRALALLEAAGTGAGSGTTSEKLASHAVNVNQPPTINGRLNEAERWVRSSRWNVWSVEHGIRLLRLGDADDDIDRVAGSSSSSSKTAGKSGGGLLGMLGFVDSTPCLRVDVPVHASNTDVFMTVVNMPPACLVGPIESLRVVEALDNSTDVVHIVLRDVHLGLTGSSPRDLCLMRYWKQNADGSYVVCLDSTQHDDCPVTTGYTRAQMHAVYLVAPPIGAEFEEDHTECMLTFIAQLDPGGWIWHLGGFARVITSALMLHIIDIRDAVEADRFVTTSFDIEAKDPTSGSHENNGAAVGADGKGSVEGDDVASRAGQTLTVSNTPPPALDPKFWSRPKPESFRLRGKTYMTDHVKTASAPCAFELVAVDMFEVKEPTVNIAAHPRNRVALAHARGDPDWFFVVNIMVPGPPNLSFVAYMRGNQEDLRADTPFGRVANPFFFGSDNEFRNNRFKLVPKIVDGPLMLRMAVKEKPALIGNKLKNKYWKGDNYFEIDVDVTSNAVAKYSTSIAIGACSMVVVDMGFCLQGENDDELPEVLMGCVKCDHIDISTAKPL